MSVLAPTNWSAFGSYDWDVETLERSPGLVQVRRSSRHITIGVTEDGDGISGRPTPADPAWVSATRAWLSVNGTVVIRSHLAPPALLVSPSGARLLPSGPDVEGTAAMTDEDVLVLCSASVLESLPSGFGTVLGSSRHPAAALDPAALLAELMAGAQHGAAAVTRRLRRPDAGPGPRRLRTARAPRTAAQEDR